MEYELDGQKFRVIGKSSAENPPKEGMWIVCRESHAKIPGKIVKHTYELHYETDDGCNTFGENNTHGTPYWNGGACNILEPVFAKKRSHKNTKRLTARERAMNFCLSLNKPGVESWTSTAARLEQIIQAHAKAALAHKAKRG